MDVKYIYAQEIKGKLVHINDARQGNIYYCPQCGNEMIPKKGEINAHHYAHKIDCTCSGESYLHRIAKLKFKEIFDKSSEFILEYRTPLVCPLQLDSKSCRFADENCNGLDTLTKRINLKKIYNQCLIEHPVNNGQFLADILLMDSTGKNQKPLMIEFYHTHKCSPDKIESGYPIVEIRINDENDLIVSNEIKLNERISIYGLKTTPCRGKNLYYVSFKDEFDASDLKTKSLNCHTIFSNNYNDYYDDVFIVVIDPYSYFEFSLDSKFKKNPPSIGEVACAIAYSRGFRDFENCAVCVNSRRSKFNFEEIWCTESKKQPKPQFNPNDLNVRECELSWPNIKRLEFIAKHLNHLKYEVLVSDPPYLP